MTLTGRFTASRFPLASVALATLGVAGGGDRGPGAEDDDDGDCEPGAPGGCRFRLLATGAPGYRRRWRGDFAVSAPGAERVDILSGATARSFAPSLIRTTGRRSTSSASRWLMQAISTATASAILPSGRRAFQWSPCAALWGAAVPRARPRVRPRLRIFRRDRCAAPHRRSGRRLRRVRLLGGIAWRRQRRRVPDLAVGMVYFASVSSFGRVYAFSRGTNTQLWVVDEPEGGSTRRSD